MSAFGKLFLKIRCTLVPGFGGLLHETASQMYQARRVPPATTQGLPLSISIER